MNLYFEVTKKETGSPVGIFTMLDTINLLLQYQELYKNSLIVSYYENVYGVIRFKGFKMINNCTEIVRAVLVV